jgi:hypothetical protein
MIEPETRRMAKAPKAARHPYAKIAAKVKKLRQEAPASDGVLYVRAALLVLGCIGAMCLAGFVFVYRWELILLDFVVFVSAVVLAMANRRPEWLGMLGWFVILLFATGGVYSLFLLAFIR